MDLSARVARVSELPAHVQRERGVDGVARGGLVNLAGAGFAGLAGLAVAWLVARSLGPTSAGVFFAVVATFVLLAGVAKLGTPTGLVYWVARLHAQGRDDLVGHCLRAGIPPVAVAATVLAAALWIAAPWLAGAIGVGSGQSGAATASLRVLAPLLPLAALTDAALSATRGYQLMRPTVVLDRLLRPALQLFGLGLLAVVAPWRPVPLPAWPLAWALPYAPVFAFAAYALVAHGRRSGVVSALVAHGRRSGPVRSGMAAPFWRFTGPRAVASVLQLALQRVDILLVAVLAGPAPAAVYAVAGRFVLLGQLANQAIGYPVQPRLAARMGAGDPAGAGALYRVATGWLVLTTWPLYLLVAVYAPVYLGLFGAPYQAAAAVVAVLAAAMLLATACGAVDILLAMAGRTSWNLGNVALALSVMVAVDVALVPRLGALGAAIGLAAAVAINNLLPLAQVWYALHIHPFGTGTLVAAGLAAGCFGALPALSTATAGTGPATVAGTVAVACALYAAGAWRLRHRLALDSFASAWSRHRRGG